MVPITPNAPTADAIFDSYQRRAQDWRKDHLGASKIGAECSRELWYGFRWAVSPHHSGRLLRLFDRGQREEKHVIQELRSIGWQVVDTDPGTGEQVVVSWFGGHFGGSCDGQVLGVPEALKTWHVLEVKTSNDRRFKELQKKGVQETNAKHWAQCQVYMHGLKLTRALYICVNKNTDEIYTERIYYDKAEAERLLAKAQAIIAAPEPPERINDSPASFFECKWCDYKDVCATGVTELLERNCRTCLSSTPCDDGTWSCDDKKHDILPDRQRAGCDSHLFIPSLLPWPVLKVHEGGILYDRGDGVTVLDSMKGLHEQSSKPE